MTKTHRTIIIPIGNSKGIRIPKEYLSALGESEVVLEKTDAGILIKPISPSVPPLSEWDRLFAEAGTNNDDDLEDWNCTISDGLKKEAPYE